MVLKGVFVKMTLEFHRDVKNHDLVGKAGGYIVKRSNSIFASKEGKLCDIAKILPFFRLYNYSNSGEG